MSSARTSISWIYLNVEMGMLYNLDGFLSPSIFSLDETHVWCFMANQSTMSSLSANDDCLGWAAKDVSGVLSPYNFSRRYV
jgi:hypothetical protein